MGHEDPNGWLSPREKGQPRFLLFLSFVLYRQTSMHSFDFSAHMQHARFCERERNHRSAGSVRGIRGQAPALKDWKTVSTRSICVSPSYLAGGNHPPPPSAGRVFWWPVPPSDAVCFGLRHPMHASSWPRLTSTRQCQPFRGRGVLCTVAFLWKWHFSVALHRADTWISHLDWIYEWLQSPFLQDEEKAPLVGTARFASRRNAARLKADPMWSRWRQKYCL